jgi:REP element-mobilizing transposase RayT
MQEIRTGRHCVFVMHVPLVFVARFRHKVFTDAHLRRMEEIMRSVCTDFECDLVEFNGEDNHVHLLVNFPPKVAVTKLVNSLEGVSSRRLRLGVPPGRRLGESSPTWRATSGGPTSSGPGPTSPGPSAVPRSPWSGSTSNSSTGRCEHHPAPPGPALATLRATGEEPRCPAPPDLNLRRSASPLSDSLHHRPEGRCANEFQ